MWKRLSVTLIGALLVLSVLLLSSCYVSAATLPAENQESVTLTFEEYSQLSRNLMTLQNNSTKQLERITQLETLLNEASNSTNQSDTALTVAQMQLQRAKQQTQEQAQQLQKLNESLQMQSEQLQKANTSLVIANQSLKELSDELKKRQAQDKKNKIMIAAITVAAVYCASR
ncbi:hypothetical protein [Veillonella magna]|uniref:hypothetical protein n=1 Tax=Veillonella magna TaxID=464322 RepID=UPI0023F1EC74|nr:hypothetical protein [Veillonella magna]